VRSLSLQRRIVVPLIPLFPLAVRRIHLIVIRVLLLLPLLVVTVLSVYKLHKLPAELRPVLCTAAYIPGLGSELRVGFEGCEWVASLTPTLTLGLRAYPNPNPKVRASPNLSRNPNLRFVLALAPTASLTHRSPHSSI